MKCKYLLLPLALLGLQASAGAKRLSLGTAQSFAVLAHETVTNTGPSVIQGNIGLYPGTSVTGFPPGTVVPPGTIHKADAVALQAQSDVTASYNVLAALTPTQNLTGQDLGGKVLTPGVYKFDSSAQLTGALTLNALGNPDALFVFQTGSSLTTASSSSVLITNGGDECNVFWQVGSSATLGTLTAFQGNILAKQSITLATNAGLLGRALAENGAVTLDTNNIALGPCALVDRPVGTFAVPEASSLALLGVGIGPLLGLLGRRSRKVA